MQKMTVERLEDCYRRGLSALDPFVAGMCGFGAADKDRMDGVICLLLVELVRLQWEAMEFMHATPVGREVDAERRKLSYGRWRDDSGINEVSKEPDMPKGTRVDRCFQKLKGSRGAGSAAAICQSSTKQNLRTGKPLKGGKKRGR